ncbi:MAG: cytochrome c [Chitinophagaceae bacterium]|nr:cytochrome c [Chitinophagaceae bacterium]
MSKKFTILLLLILFFGVYNYWIYTQSQPTTKPALSKVAFAGQKLWIKNNCNACHQFYGLGGYLGPDLTNVYSNKGEDFIKAMLNSGINTMPKFEFNEIEKNSIVAYLKEIDNTGFYPDKKATFQKNGWVIINYKNE